VQEITQSTSYYFLANLASDGYTREYMMQQKGLITIVNSQYSTQGTIEIADNTFSDNSVIKGLIYIQSYARTSPVIIFGNEFEYTFSYYSAATIFARIWLEDWKSEAEIEAKADLGCGGYLI